MEININGGSPDIIGIPSSQFFDEFGINNVEDWSTEPTPCNSFSPSESCEKDVPPENGETVQLFRLESGMYNNMFNPYMLYQGQYPMGVPLYDTGQATLVTYTAPEYTYTGNGVYVPDEAGADPGELQEQGSLHFTPWQCDECLKYFSSHPSLRRHKEIHAGVKKFTCNLCGKSYSQNHNLIKHMKLHSEWAQCEPSTSTFPGKPVRAVPASPRPKLHPCPVCTRQFAYHGCLLIHMKKHAEKKRYPCEHCKRAFKTHPKLILHQSVHAAKLARSRNKSVVTSDRSASSREKFVRTNGKSTRCREKSVRTSDKSTRSCEKSVRTSKKSTCSRDKSAHLPDKSDHTCDICLATFRFKVSLDIHMRKHVGIVVKQVKSSNKVERIKQMKCVKHLPAKRQVKKRVAKPLKIFPRNIQCQICGEKFVNRGNLKVHVASHNSDNSGHPWQCLLCDRVFSFKSNLTRHLQIHNNQKPFPCNKCGQSFRQKTTLLGHKLTHRGDRPFKCLDCNVSFTLKTHYTHHMRNHESGTIGRPSNRRASRSSSVSTPEKVNNRETRVSPRTRNATLRGRPASFKKWPECSKCGKRFHKVGTKSRHERSCKGSKSEDEESSSEEEEEGSSGEEEEGSSNSDSDDSSGDSNADDRPKRPHWFKKWPACSKCGKTFHKVGTKSRHEQACKEVKSDDDDDSSSENDNSDESEDGESESDDRPRKPHWFKQWPECITCGKKFRKVMTKKKHEATCKKEVEK